MKLQQHIIIDGYNFIFRQNPAYLNNEKHLWKAREELVQQVIAYRGNKSIRISIVFDGQDIKGITKLHRPRGIHVAFSKAPLKADPMIIKLVEKAENKRDLTVVTSDNSLARIVQSMGCTVWSVELLYQRMNKEANSREYEKKYNVNIGPKELEEWERLFNENDET